MTVEQSVYGPYQERKLVTSRSIRLTFCIDTRSKYPEYKAIEERSEPSINSWYSWRKQRSDPSIDEFLTCD